MSDTLKVPQPQPSRKKKLKQRNFKKKSIFSSVLSSKRESSVMQAAQVNLGLSDDDLIELEAHEIKARHEEVIGGKTAVGATMLSLEEIEQMKQEAKERRRKEYRKQQKTGCLKSCIS